MARAHRSGIAQKMAVLFLKGGAGLLRGVPHILKGNDRGIEVDAQLARLAIRALDQVSHLNPCPGLEQIGHPAEAGVARIRDARQQQIDIEPGFSRHRHCFQHFVRPQLSQR